MQTLTTSVVRAGLIDVVCANKNEAFLIDLAKAACDLGSLEWAEITQVVTRELQDLVDLDEANPMAVLGVLDLLKKSKRAPSVEVDLVMLDQDRGVGSMYFWERMQHAWERIEKVALFDILHLPLGEGFTKPEMKQLVAGIKIFDQDDIAKELATIVHGGYQQKFEHVGKHLDQLRQIVDAAMGDKAVGFWRRQSEAMLHMDPSWWDYVVACAQLTDGEGPANHALQRMLATTEEGFFIPQENIDTLAQYFHQHYPQSVRLTLRELLVKGAAFGAERLAQFMDTGALMEVLQEHVAWQVRKSPTLSKCWENFVISRHVGANNTQAGKRKI